MLEMIDRVPRMLQSRELTDGLPFAEPGARIREEVEPVG